MLALIYKRPVFPVEFNRAQAEAIDAILDHEGLIAGLDLAVIVNTDLDETTPDRMLDIMVMTFFSALTNIILSSSIELDGVTDTDEHRESLITSILSRFEGNPGSVIQLVKMSSESVHLKNVFVVAMCEEEFWSALD